MLAGAYESARRLPPAPLASQPLARPRGGLPTDSAAAGGAAAATAGEASGAVAPPDTAVGTPPPPATYAPPPPPEDEVVHCPPPPPLRFRRHPAVAMPRRYVGTVGGQPATAELEVARATITGGLFYLWRGGPAYELQAQERGRVATVLTPIAARFTWEEGQLRAGTWHLAGPVGAVLTGYWQDAAGRRRPLVLRESYVQAVRYELQAMTLWGGPSGTDFTCLVPHYKRDYLQLLGSVSLAMRRQQAPPLARRRRQMRASFAAGEDCEYAVTVRLNGFDLLSYQTVYSNDPFGGRPGYEQTGTLIDLVSGRRLSLASQLRLHYEMPLRQLLAQHLLHDAEFSHINKYHKETWQWADSTRAAADTADNKSLWTWRPYAPLSAEEATVFTGEGLEVNYWLGSLQASGAYNRHLNVVVPYAELRPLVRPGTPLARMLRARGMW